MYTCPRDSKWNETPAYHEHIRYFRPVTVDCPCHTDSFAFAALLSWGNNPVAAYPLCHKSIDKRVDYPAVLQPIAPSCHKNSSTAWASPELFRFSPQFDCSGRASINTNTPYSSFFSPWFLLPNTSVGSPQERSTGFPLTTKTGVRGAQKGIKVQYCCLTALKKLPLGFLLPLSAVVRLLKPTSIFPDPDGNIRVGVRFLDETAWLSQKFMAELFQVSVPNMNRHLKHIFEGMGTR